MYLMNNTDFLAFGWSPDLCRKVSRVYSRSDGHVKFMGFHCLKKNDYEWQDFASPVFYQPVPSVGHSHYFAFIKGAYGDKVSIVNGESAFCEPIDGLEADNGEVIYSRFRHDYVTSQDGSVSIDGGRDYTRTSTNDPSKRVTIVARGPELVIQQGNYDPKNHPHQYRPERELRGLSARP